jgi:hypothetical protein
MASEMNDELLSHVAVDAIVTRNSGAELPQSSMKLKTPLKIRPNTVPAAFPAIGSKTFRRRERRWDVVRLRYVFIVHLRRSDLDDRE